jgi:uncharacterized membrane protein
MSFQFRRCLRHLLSEDWSAQRAFSRENLAAIETEIAYQEQRHAGELRFVVEAALSPFDALNGLSANRRAIQLFGQLGVWDTEQNCGVLIYLLLADKRVEILADRGVHRRAGSPTWESICSAMQHEFAAGRFEQGALLGIRAVGDVLATHFPANTAAGNPNELPDRPLLL